MVARAARRVEGTAEAVEAGKGRVERWEAERVRITPLGERWGVGRGGAAGGARRRLSLSLQALPQRSSH